MLPILNPVHFWEESASYKGVSGDMFRQCSAFQVQRAKEHFVMVASQPIETLRNPALL